MYRVCFIRMTPKGPKPETVTHPNLDVAMVIHDALKFSGAHVRLWDGEELVTPERMYPVALSNERL